jgi:FKBP-type peptidyl-prolyl cis-trans isomerase FkpA
MGFLEHFSGVGKSAHVFCARFLRPGKGHHMTCHSRLHSASGPSRGPLVRRLLALTAALALSAGAAGADAAQAEDLSDDEKTFYYMGIAMEQKLRALTLSDEELALLIRGLREAHAGKPLELDGATYRPKLQELGQQRMKKAAKAEKLKAHAFLAEAAQRRGAIRTESGLIYTEITPGSGDSPEPTATVKVNYHGTLRDGSVFDSSAKRGSPFEFNLEGVIPCWKEGVGMMKVGGKSIIICPPEIAYGERGAPPLIPGNAALSFEVELIEIK